MTIKILELLKKIGWPEWDGSGEKIQLRWSHDNGWHLWWTYQDVWGPMNSGGRVQDHQALCLVRNHLREWLHPHGVSPEVMGPGWEVE